MSTKPDAVRKNSFCWRRQVANNVETQPIDANPRARATFETLGRLNLFALAFRTNNVKTPAGRARKIATLVATLARGKPIVPESRPKPKR